MTPAEEVRLLWGTAGHETNYRTVTSRAYYACFNRTLAYAGRRGFVRLMTGQDHGSVAEFLRVARHHPVQPNLLFRIGAQRLPKLRKLRNRADYVMDEPFTKASAEEAVALLDEITGYLHQVEPDVGETA